jgi:hypothetical protein
MPFATPDHDGPAERDDHGPVLHEPFGFDFDETGVGA